MSRPRGVATTLTVLLGAALVAVVVIFGGGSAPGVFAAPDGAPADRPSNASPPTMAAHQERSAAEERPAAAPEAARQQQPRDRRWPVPEVRAVELEPTGQTAEQAIVDHNTATRGPRQPIPFSHRFHVRELRIDCMYCHLGTERSETGVVPSLEVCMGCHRTAGAGLEPIQELQDHWNRGEPVRWEWVSKLPDFVQFPHRAHVRTGIQCQECHGPVEDMDRVYRWAPLTMGWCLECHRSQPQETDVATDYVLVREHPIPEIPDRRQAHSFYPVRIDTKYGAYRAPIDCFACHY